MTQDEPSSKLGALVNKLMPGRPQRMQLACDAEVEAAARMLVQRLAGAQQGVEAEEEEDGQVGSAGALQCHGYTMRDVGWNSQAYWLCGCAMLSTTSYL